MNTVEHLAASIARVGILADMHTEGRITSDEAVKFLASIFETGYQELIQRFGKERATELVNAEIEQVQFVKMPHSPETDNAHDAPETWN